MMLPVTKFRSCGSDQLIIRLSDEQFQQLDLVKFSQFACDRKKILGADGLGVIVGTDGQDHHTFHAFTPDGNQPELCVNASLSAACYILIGNNTLDSVTLNIKNTDYNISLIEKLPFQLYKICFSGLKARKANFGEIFLTSEDRTVSNIIKNIYPDVENYFLEDVGTPQIYISVKKINEDALSRLGIKLNATGLTSNGVNVTAVTHQKDSNYIVRTFERGGAGLTQSCASASAGSALAIRKFFNDINTSLNIYTKGGLFEIEFQSESESTATFAITGTVSPIYTASLDMSKYEDYLSNGKISTMSGNMYIESMTAHDKHVSQQLKSILYDQYVTGVKNA